MSEIPDPVDELFGVADLVSPVNRFLEAKEYIDKAKWCCGVRYGKGEIDHDSCEPWSVLDKVLV